MRTRKKFLLAVTALLCIAWTGQATASGKVYRWVDENGVVHFGDAIPPEYSRDRHDVVDERGRRTTVHEEKTPAPAPASDQRDRALLATYGSVAEIEALRDRRVGYLESQNAVAEDRLRNLHVRQQELDGNPAAINERATVTQRIREYDAEIERRNVEIARIREEFAGDIVRYRELRGLDEPEETAAQADR